MNLTNNRSNNNSTIDLVKTINSGQYFLWEKKDKKWYGIYGETILKITENENVKEKDNGSRFEYDSFHNYERWYEHIFRMDDKYDEIIYDISQKDEIIYKMIKKYPGLRLMRQNPVQCILSFLCSSNNNIPRIRYMLRNLSKRFGKRVIWDGMEFYTFPTLKSLYNASISDLLSCGLGYRAKYVLNTVKDISDKNLDIDLIQKQNYEVAKEEIMKLDGVGEKIADCILLFSFDKLEAFPMDVWIIKFFNQNLHQIIKNDIIKMGLKITTSQYKTISKKIRDHYGKYSGYAQQYMYYSIREESGRKW